MRPLNVTGVCAVKGWRRDKETAKISHEVETVLTAAAAENSSKASSGFTAKRRIRQGYVLAFAVYEMGMHVRRPWDDVQPPSAKVKRI